MAMFRRGQYGHGPGPLAPDGSSVALYEVLPPSKAPRILHAALPDGVTVLDLGSGVGRIAHPLAALGHRVVAVDERADMLAHVHCERIHSTIEALRLDRRLDAVLLASYLVNAADTDLRPDLLRTCRHDVQDGDCVFIKRHQPGTFDQPALVLRSSKLVGKAVSPGSWGWPADPGFGMGVELDGGQFGGVADLTRIGERLPGQSVPTEDAPPGLLQVQPAGSPGDEHLVDAQMPGQPGPGGQAGME